VIFAVAFVICSTRAVFEFTSNASIVPLTDHFGLEHLSLIELPEMSVAIAFSMLIIGATFEGAWSIHINIIPYF
jgi:hypothetical protein